MLGCNLRRCRIQGCAERPTKVCLTVALIVMTSTVGSALDSQQSRFVDHRLLIAEDYPCTWPSHPFPRFSITHQQAIGLTSAYNVDMLLIDGNTRTQMDVPPYSVAMYCVN